ncbi:MAG: GtrA family protein [Clostridia bacterium]|nr:GtrA family protein [Clostridia bacterium]
MINKLYRWAKSLDKRIKFILVGALNTLIGYGTSALILLLVYKIPLDAISKATDIQALIAAVCGHTLGMVNSFFWNKFFTFANNDKSFTQVYKFLFISLLQLGLNYGLIIFLQNVLGAGIYIAQAITLILTTVISYLGHNYFTFKKQ